MSLFIGAAPLDFVVGKIIEKGTGGDKTKIAARAQAAYNAAIAATGLLGDDPATAVNQLAAIVQGDTNLAPYEALAINNAVGLASQQLAFLKSVPILDLLSSAGQGVVAQIMAEVEKVAVAEGAVVPAAKP